MIDNTHIRVIQIRDDNICSRVYTKQENCEFEPDSEELVKERNQKNLNTLLTAKNIQDSTLIIVDKLTPSRTLAQVRVDNQIAKIHRDVMTKVQQENPDTKVGFIVRTVSNQKFKKGKIGQYPAIEKLHDIGYSNMDRLFIGNKNPIPAICFDEAPLALADRIPVDYQIRKLLDHFDAAIRSDGKGFVLIGNDKQGPESKELHEATYILDDPYSPKSFDRLKEIIESIEDPWEKTTREIRGCFEKCDLATMIIKQQYPKNTPYYGNNTFEKAIELLKKLQARGVNLAEIRSSTNGTLLDQVCTFKMVQWLVSQGVDPTIKNRSGKTPADNFRELSLESLSGEASAYTRIANWLDAQVSAIK